MTRLPSARSLEVRSAMPRSMCASSRNVFGRRSGIRTRTPVRAHPFEGCMAAVSSSGGDSPCLLVKGADCAGVCLAVLAWLCPGLSRDARSRVARIELWPRLIGGGGPGLFWLDQLVPTLLIVARRVRGIRKYPLTLSGPASDSPARLVF